MDLRARKASAGLSPAARPPAENRLRPRDAVLAAGLTLLFLLPMTMILMPIFRADRLIAVAVAVLAQGLATAGAAVIVLHHRGLRWKMIGWDTGIRSVVMGLFGGLLVFVLVQIGGWLVTRAAAPVPVSPSLRVMFSGHGATGLTIFIAAAGLLAPISEELFFRGILYSALRNRYGRVAGILASATAFALLHGDISLGMLPVWMAGVVFSCLYESSGSLVAPILAHGIHNTATALVFYFLS